MNVLRENNLILLYLGFFFCICIALFNSYTIFLNFTRERLEKKRLERWRKRLACQRETYAENKLEDVHFRRKFKRYLRFDTSLLYLETVFDEISAGEMDEEQQMLLEMWLSEIVNRYRKSDPVVIKYLAFLAGKYCVHSADIDQFLMGLLEGEKLDICEEAFYSICNINHSGLLRRAFKTLNRRAESPNRKVIADALERFHYTGNELENNGMDDLFLLKPELQVGVIDYFGEELSDDIREQMLNILDSGKSDKEVRIAVIKFFGRVYYRPAQEVLLKMADSSQWEYAATAAKALGMYPGETTICQVMRRISDTNWHVRSNNAMTLGLLGADKQIEEILAGDDRYAKDIMQYTLSKLGRKGGWDDGVAESDC